MQRAGQTLPCQAPSRPSCLPTRPSLNRHCNTNSELRTLKGEKVKSFEELTIANWLAANSIRYEYERAYECHTASSRYRQYEPDFYLTDYGIYIEPGLLHLDFGEVRQDFDQVVVVPTGPFQLASHGAFRRFQPGQVQRQLP